MKRRIIEIDQEKCNGCGACAQACHEGAIGMVNGKAQLLRDERLAPAQRQEHVETIEKYARRLTDLITNILKLNKLEKQTIQPKPEPYDLCAQLAECALLFEQRWEDKGLELEADLEDACTVEADESLMELV